MPDRVVVDSGPCIALFNRDDEYHERAVSFIRKSEAELISTLSVVTEAMYVLDFSLTAQTDFLSWVFDGAITLIDAESNDLKRVVERMKKYADRPMDFTDGLLVAVCERLDIRRIASVDDDLMIYRFRNRGRFTNVFFE